MVSWKDWDQAYYHIMASRQKQMKYYSWALVAGVLAWAITGYWQLIPLAIAYYAITSVRALKEYEHVKKITRGEGAS